MLYFQKAIGGIELNNLPYDETNPTSILEYAKKLIGKTFEDITNSNFNIEIINENASYDDKKKKGGLGNLLEEKYFGYKANSNQEPDFPEAGVELKATCYEKKKSGKISAGERLVLTMISYEEPVEFDFYKSHVWDKSKLILLIYYERNKELLSNMLYKIDYVDLFSPPKTDLKVILNDYNKIIKKIQLGLANELSESDTLYLGACTKGATAEKSSRPQYYAPHTLAKKRAFCFKRSYMDYVLNTYIVPQKKTYESIIKDSNVLDDISFEDYVLKKINVNIGKTDEELCYQYEREYNNNKTQWIQLAYLMLGIKSSHAEEFEKANIVVKAIRLEEDNRMIESMSFPVFKFLDIVNEKWENSNLYEYFEQTKFLFVIYKKQKKAYKLIGSTIWNMPYDDLNEEVKNGWETVQRVIKEGIVLDKKITKNGIECSNNLIKKKDNRIIHVRPHAQKSAYKFSDGLVIGNIERDANELPDGRWMTNQSFWINNSYILKQIEKYIE